MSVVGIPNLPNVGGKRRRFCRAHIVRPYKGDVYICGKDMIAFWRRKVYDGVGLILSATWIDSGRARRRDDVNIYLRPGLRPPV